MSPVADNIADFKSGTYVVTRTMTGGYSNGRSVTGAQTTFNIDAVMLPTNGNEILRLEEGERSKESKVLITEGSLRTVGDGFEADVVAIGAHSYQVSAVEDWTQFGFIKAIVVKRGRA